MSTYVFDVDGTLYPSTSGIESRIVPALRQACATAMDMSVDDVRPIMRRLSKTYGHSVIGFEKEFGIKADRLISDAHARIDRSYVERDESLVKAFDHLAQKEIRVVALTNSSRDHGTEIIERLGLASYFDKVYGIEDSLFQLKPEKEAYRQLLKNERVEPQEVLYFDDSVRNTHIAWRLDFRCVLVHNGLVDPPMFWENHLKVAHLPPEHYDSTFNLADYLQRGPTLKPDLQSAPLDIQSAPKPLGQPKTFGSVKGPTNSS